MFGFHTPQERTVSAPVTIPASAAVAAGAGVGVISPPPVAVATARLVAVRGQRVNVEYPLYEGKNFIGRSAETPADIDLTLQEPVEQVWASRQHAVITFDSGQLILEDLNSLNGTFVNRVRLRAGQRRRLLANDVIAIGTVHLKVVID
jgi:pSer/pThr/pTyr-binding forkhead associated (FHA) protein